MTPPSQFESWLFGSLWEDVDRNWNLARFGRFRIWNRPTDVEALVKAILSKPDSYSLYAAQSISAKTFAYLLFVLKTLDLIGTDNRFISELDREIGSGSTRFGLPVVPTLSGLPTRLVEILIGLEYHDVIAKIIRYIYTEYEELLKHLLKHSDDYMSWESNLQMLVPYLLLKNFIPVHDHIVSGGQMIALPDLDRNDTSAPMIDHNTISRVSRFYRNLFDSDEIHYFEQSEQRMTEIMVHVMTLLIAKIDITVQSKRTAVLTEANLRGPVQGIQLASLYYRSELSIPKYVYQELRDQILG